MSTEYLAEHCMHPAMWNTSSSEPEHRVCCWCGLQQDRAYTSAPRHGPHFPGESRDFHWVPAAAGHRCPQRTTPASEPRVR